MVRACWSSISAARASGGKDASYQAKAAVMMMRAKRRPGPYRILVASGAYTMPVADFEEAPPADSARRA
jgi:hypothetical protein